MGLRWGTDDDTLSSGMGDRSSVGGYDHESVRAGLLKGSREEGRRETSASKSAEAAAVSAQKAMMRQKAMAFIKASAQAAITAGTAMGKAGGAEGALGKKSAALEAKATRVEGAGGSAERVAGIRTRAAQVGGRAEVAGLKSKYGRGRKLFQRGEAAGAPGSGGQADILEAISPTPYSTAAPGVKGSYAATETVADPMTGIREWQQRRGISQAGYGTNPSKGKF